MQYRGTKKSIQEIGRELNVDAIVEGTVTYAGNRVRVTAQLIQVATDMHLWADAYERDLSSILDLQRSLATDIARRINAFVKPLDRARVVNPEAYGLYLKGRYAFYKYTSAGWQQRSNTSTERLKRIRHSHPRTQVSRTPTLCRHIRRGPNGGGTHARTSRGGTGAPTG
jgi:hypothetical protein